ncbi:adenylyl-sulfate kinase, partial [Nocardioides sp.]|uniref:adenylyl-sulfate kinase n=1 Tax=Nocardioides sp. TaxID=35761 RepID=UPI002736FF60
MSTPTPQHCPTPRELDDLELLTTGALAPLTGFNEPGSAVTLGLPADLAEAEAVELVDPEGLPLAVVAADGSVTPLTHAQFGPFRRLYLTPAQAREQYAGATWVPVVGPLTEGQLTRLGEEPGPLVLLTLAGTGTPQGLSTVGLVRATLAGAARLPDASVVVVPLASHGDHEADHALGVRVVDNYAADDPILALPSSSVVEVIASSSVDEEVASSSVVEELASSSVVEEVAQQPSRDPRPLDLYPPEVESIIDFDRPVPEEQGLVLFFTGLSGSGKSTLARALMDRLLEQGTRTVTSLDGDVVRRNLSAGLTFSKADRETNIRRIGWVAAEISRHGGVAVCSPIAPFDETRQQVRAMVEEAGGAFFLVHVATPLEECERRDRKGLYAKARRGEIPEFTGISSPYEEPEDAAVRVDTTGRSIEAALDDVLDALRETGYLDLPSSPVEKVASGSPVEEGASGSPVEEGASGSPVEEVAQQPSRDQDTPDPQAPIKVLFVCTANICRSAFMHLYAEHLLRD